MQFQKLEGNAAMEYFLKTPLEDYNFYLFFGVPFTFHCKNSIF
jgi:hypothetical protein